MKVNNSEDDDVYWAVIKITGTSQIFSVPNIWIIQTIKNIKSGERITVETRCLWDDTARETDLTKWARRRKKPGKNWKSVDAEILSKAYTIDELLAKENLALKNTADIDAVYKEMQESGKKTRKVRKRKKVADYTSGEGLSTAADEKETEDVPSSDSEMDAPSTSLMNTPHSGTLEAKINCKGHTPKEAPATMSQNFDSNSDGENETPAANLDCTEYSTDQPPAKASPSKSIDPADEDGYESENNEKPKGSMGKTVDSRTETEHIGNDANKNHMYNDGRETWHILKLEKTKEYHAVPSSWVDMEALMCSWPPHGTLMIEKNYIEARQNPDPNSWQQFKVLATRSIVG